MKKIIFLTFFTLFSLFSFSQNAKYIYCELVGTGKLFSTKVTVEIDYGQATSFWKNDKRMVDESGKPIKFNSMVDAMNYMGNEGWEFEQAYVVTMNNQNVYHWLLKKNITTLTDEEKAGMLESYKTKSDIKE